MTAWRIPSRNTIWIELTTIAVAVLLGGCQDRSPVTAPPAIQQTAQPAVEGPGAAYLSVSNLTPVSGSTIVVAGNVRLDDSLTIASYVARLTYDHAALVFLDEVAGSDMMHVVNAQSNQVTIAAASAQGSTSGSLFKLRFRVDDPAGLASLSLAISELNDRQFMSRVGSLKMSQTLRFDRSLVPTRVTR